MSLRSDTDAPLPLARVAIVSVGTLLAFFDSTLWNALFPAILVEFRQGVSDTSWVVSGASLALAGSLLLGGALGDRFGRRRILVVGLLMYATSAAACLPASELGFLIAARICMGVSSALVLATSMALIVDETPPRRRAVAIGIYSAIGGLGALLGPIFGAFIVDAAGWRAAPASSAAFFTAVAIAALCIRGSGRDEPRLVDGWLPIGLFGLATVGTVFAATAASSPPGMRVAIGGGSAAVGALLVLRERRSDAPLVPPALRRLAFARPLVGTFTLGFALGLGLFAIPLFLTQVRGTSVSEGGIALLPATVLTVAMAVVSGRISQERGFGTASLAGMLLATGVVFAFNLLGADSPEWFVWLASAVAGVAFGLGLPAMGGDALEAAGTAHSGVGSAFYNMARVLGIAFGAAAFAGALTFQAGASPRSETGSRDAVIEQATRCPTPACVEHLLRDLRDPAEATRARALLREQFGRRFRGAFGTTAVVSGLLLAVWLFLSRTRFTDPGGARIGVANAQRGRT